MAVKHKIRDKKGALVEVNITNRNMLARFDAAIIGWSLGSGMPNITIEYPMEVTL